MADALLNATPHKATNEWTLWVVAASCALHPIEEYFTGWQRWASHPAGTSLQNRQGNCGRSCKGPGRPRGSNVFAHQVSAETRRAGVPSTAGETRKVSSAALSTREGAHPSCFAHISPLKGAHPPDPLFYFPKMYAAP